MLYGYLIHIRITHIIYPILTQNFGSEVRLQRTRVKYLPSTLRYEPRLGCGASNPFDRRAPTNEVGQRLLH